MKNQEKHLKKIWKRKSEFFFKFSSFPFDVHSLHGYFAYLSMVIIALHTYAILITSQAGFFLSSSFYMEAFTKDFDQMMHQLNLIDRKAEKSVVQTRLFDAVKFNIRIIEYD